MRHNLQRNGIYSDNVSSLCYLPREPLSGSQTFNMCHITRFSAIEVDQFEEILEYLDGRSGSYTVGITEAELIMQKDSMFRSLSK